MGRIFVLGSESIRPVTNLIDCRFVEYPSPRPNAHGQIHDFLVGILDEPADALVLYADSETNLALNIALHVRLSLGFLKENALCPIILMTDLGADNLLRLDEKAQIFMTEGVYQCPPSEVAEFIAKTSPLLIERYEEGFLEKIHILPPARSGKHSLANQWGAGVMYRLVTGHDYSDGGCETLENARKDLYFKYSRACTADDCEALLDDSASSIQRDLTVDARGKKILLIDDMADMGWTEALRAMLIGAEMDVIKERVLSFEELSPDSRRKIIDGDYDLYLLDLRLGGEDEESRLEPEAFSGMKVLQEIKNTNRGRQVIMFTASNKAWNFKALLSKSGGANGYYIKESPEFSFTESFSAKSLEGLKKEIEECFERNYLKRLYQFKEETLDDPSGNSQVIQELKSQMDIAFELAETAESPAQNKFAYLAIYQAFEIIVKDCIDVDRSSGMHLLYVNTDGGRVKVGDVIPERIEPLKYRTIETSRANWNNAIFEKLSAIFLTRMEDKDDGILQLIRMLHNARNCAVHIDKEPRYSTPLSKQQFNARYSTRLEYFRNHRIAPLMEELADLGLIKEVRKPGSYNSSYIVFGEGIVYSRLGSKLIAECVMRYTDLYLR